MTVQELIERLKTLNPDQEIKLYNQEFPSFDIVGIDEETEDGKTHYEIYY